MRGIPRARACAFSIERARSSARRARSAGDRARSMRRASRAASAAIASGRRSRRSDAMTVEAIVNFTVRGYDAPKRRGGAPCSLEDAQMRFPTFTTVSLAAVLAVAAAGADAVTLRWAGRGDMQTTDPHSQNENLTNNINAQIYEPLVVRDKQLKQVPALAE